MTPRRRAIAIKLRAAKWMISVRQIHRLMDRVANMTTSNAKTIRAEGSVVWICRESRA